MQELLVRFEPPDIYGVPPNKDSLKASLPLKISSDDSDSVPILSSHERFHATPTDAQPSSLPTELTGSVPPIFPAAMFQSLPPLNSSKWCFLGSGEKSVYCQVLYHLHAGGSCLTISYSKPLVDTQLSECSTVLCKQK